MNALRGPLLGLLTWLCVVLPSLAFAQNQTDLAGPPNGCPGATEYPCGAAMKVTPDAAATLIRKLNSSPEAEYGDILKEYLGKSYGRHFNDWIVYIGKNHQVK